MRCVFRVLSKKNNNQLILFNLYGCAVSSHHQHTATTSNFLPYNNIQFIFNLQL